MVEVELWWRTARGLGSDVGGTRVLGRCGSQAAGGRRLVRVRLRDVGVAEQALLADRLQKMQLNSDQRRFQIAGLAEGLTAAVEV